ncbi:hypothetical protein OSTOST_02311 [Ostertagia ostertagi]
MLPILGLFLLFLGNVNAQGKEPLPKRCEKIYERFIKEHTRGLTWNDELASEALDMLMRGYSMDFSYDLKLLVSGTFPKSDNSSLEDKVSLTLESAIFTPEYKRLKQLAYGTLYGCEGINKTKGDEDVLMILCLFKKSIDLPASMRATFERLNRKYNKYLVWDEEIASDALEESKSPTKDNTTYLKLRARMVFRKDDSQTSQGKGSLNLQKVSLLRNGTLYGCDGIYDTKRDYNQPYVCSVPLSEELHSELLVRFC